MCWLAPCIAATTLNVNVKNMLGKMRILFGSTFYTYKGVSVVYITVSKTHLK